MNILVFYILLKLKNPVNNITIVYREQLINFFFITNIQLENTKVISNLKASGINSNIVDLTICRLKSHSINKLTNNNLFLSFFLIYQNLFIQKLLSIPTQSKNVNVSNLFSSELLAFLMFNLRHVKWWKYGIKHNNQLVELILICVQLKNLNLFTKWIKKYFEFNSLKKHKKLFLIFNYILLKLIWKFNLSLNIRGIRLILKGKFSKAGSVRKTKKTVKKGKISYTNKALALVKEKIIIRTITGTLGISLELFF